MDSNLLHEKGLRTPFWWAKPRRPLPFIAFLLPNIVIKAGGRLVQQFGCHAEVDLSASEARVPQVRRQVREQLLNVGPLPVPRGQPVDGKGVPLMPSSA
jgi:hypothetical protein